MIRTRALAFLLVGGLLLGACGDVTPESLAYATADTEPTVLRLATPRIAGFEDVIADWEREHPTARVDVVVRNSNDHHRSLLEDAGAGGQFDVVAFDASFAPDVRASDDLLVDLGAFEATPDASTYLAARWAEGIADDGALIGLPLDVESTALLVRTDLVEPDLVRALREAETWCELLVAGDAFSDETNTAFLADADDLLAAILAQSRTSFVNDDGTFARDELDELQRAWDLAMMAIGEGPLHDNPCPGVEDIQRMARNLNFDSAEWRVELRDADFGAVLAPWSFRRRIANAAPETAGQWTTIDLPSDSRAPGAGSSSDGGLHLGIHLGSQHFDLAYDLLLTLTNPTVQEVAFADGTGPLPSAAQPHADGIVSRAEDDFFVDSIFANTYSEAALARPTSLASSERRIVVEAMMDALNRVESGGQTPEEAWMTMRDQVAKALG